jgi:hypothetical protein
LRAQLNSKRHLLFKRHFAVFDINHLIFDTYSSLSTDFSMKKPFPLFNGMVSLRNRMWR